MMRQPVHVVYGGAHLFKPGLAARIGKTALAVAGEFGPLTQVFGVSESVAARVLSKLRTQPVEDYRIDFEDGYGYRVDAEEDAHAESAGRIVGERGAGLPPMIGIRIKSLSPELGGRALRTLELFLRAMGSPAPPQFAVTLPKVTSAS